MASRALIDLDPRLSVLAQKFIALCAAAGLDVVITETYRSAEEQDAYYAKGRTTPGPTITNARGGESPHNCTLPDGTPGARAFDFALYAPGVRRLDWDASDDQWQKAIEIGKSLGLVSGATFPVPDSDHFELPDWQNV